MDNNFRQGFEKTAIFAELASVIGSIVMPSVNKRIMENTFEMSKKKAVGLSIEKESKGISGKLGLRVNKDLDFVEKLPDGFRKKLNRALMREGPGLALYAPAEGGRRLGKTIDRAANHAPFARQILSDLTSIDAATSKGAKDRITNAILKLKSPKVLAGAGVVAGGLGALLLRAMTSRDDDNGPLPHEPLAKKEEGLSYPPLYMHQAEEWPSTY